MDIPKKNQARKIDADMDKPETIQVTHVTIRQSIMIMVGNLIALDIIGIIILVIAFFGLMQFGLLSADTTAARISGIAVILIVSLVKLGLEVFIVLSWVNNYYEITPQYITHKKGYIFQNESNCSMHHVGSVKLDQGLFGRIFNFGTINCFNWEEAKYATLYHIHNPRKYLKVLEDILPGVDLDKKMLREKIIQDEKL